VYGIVQQSHGFLWAYSEPELGTSFTVYLRLVGAAVEATPAPRPAAPLPGAEITVLLVEDDSPVRALVRAASRSPTASGNLIPTFER
jgi:two-component system cell cycle sensor histidine kinase/response regulator CckA